MEGFDATAANAAEVYPDVFDRDVTTTAIELKRSELTGALLQQLRGFVLARRGVRGVLDASTAGGRKILLEPAAIEAPGTTHVEQLPEAVRLALEALGAGSWELQQATFHETAKNFTMEEILGRLLPAGVIVPSGFEQVGHIAHVNLQQCHDPYKGLIGKVILDCNRNSGVRTVVNKLEIASEFRELKLELLAGDADFEARVREHGNTFVVPYDKVYWNSKLSREHTRLVELLGANDELFDVMAGIGPFVVPALKKGLVVYGNDLNPASVASMKVNVNANCKKAAARFHPSCEDGRQFIRRMRKELLTRGETSDKRRHFVMNLPAIAVEFLDAFTGDEWQDSDGVEHDKSFVVHCYCFSKTETNEAAMDDAVAQCSKHLDCEIDVKRDIVNLHVVRDVAPRKLMVCVSFTLPPAMWHRRKTKRVEKV
jgi:tRNA (guanine37-N1)-methyltransferase